jgi:hypothetical protein
LLFAPIVLIWVSLLGKFALHSTFGTQAYSEASVIVDLWLPGKLLLVLPKSRVRYTAYRIQAFHTIVWFHSCLGAETVSHEAVLFDVIVIVAGWDAVFSPFEFLLLSALGLFYLAFPDEMNGKDDRDFPIPQEFRVSRNALSGTWNYTQLAGAIAKGIYDYDDVLPQVSV